MINDVISIITGFIGYTLVIITLLLWIWCKINKSRSRTWTDATPDGSYVLAFVFGSVLLLAAGFCFMISANGPGVVSAIVG